jgi:hypothetical protein
MGKVAALAVVLIAAYFVFRPGGASSADKVADCVAQSGATITETRLLQGGEGLPRQIKSRLLEVEKRNYVVQLGDDSGLLILVRSSRSADEVSRSLVAAEGRETIQRAGKFVMYWRTAPSSESAGILGRCLH